MRNLQMRISLRQAIVMIVLAAAVLAGIQLVPQTSVERVVPYLASAAWGS